MSKIIIRNGQIVSPWNTITGDVLIEGEIIAGITTPGAVQWADAREIDATGCYVFPGVVDPHTHIQLDTGVYKTDDNWEIGTRCAAYGGVTTVVDFATQFKDMTFREALDHRLEECRPAFIDYGLHMMVTDLSRDPEQARRDLSDLRDMGVPSIKLYTTYRPNYYADDATLLHTFNAMPDDMIAMVHCENDAIVADATARLVEQGKTGWRYHGESRPEEAEIEAALRVINLCVENFHKPVYIVHCSSSTTVDKIIQFKAAHGSKNLIYFETCIQYLTLDHSRYESKEPEKFILQPPLRDINNIHNATEIPNSKVSLFAVDFDHLINLVQDTFVVSTDHCDYSLAQKQAKDDFRITPGGLPGLETLLPLTFTAFVVGAMSGVKRRVEDISINRLVEVLSTNPAKIFGLYPQKGIIQPGSDADVVIYDPAPEVTIRAEDLHYIGGYTPYEGMKVQGKVRTTISRGSILVDEGQFVAQDLIGRGRFLPGKPFKPLSSF